MANAEQRAVFPLRDYDLAATLASGQAFRWRQNADAWEGVIAGATPGTEGLATFLSLMFSLNLLLGLFNLVPVPPLDGYSALGLLLPENAAAKLQEWRMEYARFSFLGILIAWRLFDTIGFKLFWGVAILILYT